MVWELEGPMPILKMSKTLRLMRKPWIARRNHTRLRAAALVLESACAATVLLDRGDFMYRSLNALRRLLPALAVTCLAAAAASSTVPAFLASAIADPNRPAADVARDADRKPAETLMFTGLAPGQQVAELLPGAGYFTRIMSKAVGPGGHVYALVPAPRPDAPPNTPDFAARIKAIAADPAYGNLSVVVEPFGQLKTPVPVDLVWTSQNYHDLHNLPGLDLAVFNQLVFEALKPGGTYLILDHATEPGMGASQTSTLHRIDPEVVKREVLAAGFVYDGESNLLRQPADPHTATVFDPSIRGKTDQFILKFKKPAHP
jgi:predicted methyltransferase